MKHLRKSRRRTELREEQRDRDEVGPALTQVGRERDAQARPEAAQVDQGSAPAGHVPEDSRRAIDDPEDLAVDQTDRAAADSVAQAAHLQAARPGASAQAEVLGWVLRGPHPR